jgi:hypothetical protein
MRTGRRTVEVEISPGKTLRVEGLQWDRRRRNDLRITLPDGRIVLAWGRRPAEQGWIVELADHSNSTGGLDLGDSLAFLLGYDLAFEDPPEWLDRFMAAVE